MDPDARIAVNPGKAPRLCYLTQLSVDTSRHVITHAQADPADRKDNQCLPSIIKSLTSRLEHLGLRRTALLADAGYSSGENYHLLEGQQITSCIPPHGTCKGGPEGFTYNKAEDCWLCPWGRKATFRKVKVEPKNNIKKRVYFTTRRDCKGCPYREGCIGKNHEKKVEITYYWDEYERVISRLSSRWGRRMKGLRQATVEPVLGTPVNFMGLGRINARGLQLAAAAYNLQKLLRFSQKRSQTAVMALPRPEKQLHVLLIFTNRQGRWSGKGIGGRNYA